MEQEKIAKLIKQIRKDNKLTQKQLADKYNLTYQAVSKWERGLNLPDTSLLKQMSKDFNISIDDILEGEFSKKQTKIKTLYILSITIIIITIIIAIVIININSKKTSTFEFKTLSSQCDNFNISGNIAYNDAKTSIYINNIKYCGGDDTTKYKKIECILYESSNGIEKQISSYKYTNKKNITLEEFLQTVTITVDDYQKNCKEFSKNSLYLKVNAEENNNKTTTYKIPLTLTASCPK